MTDDRRCSESVGEPPGYYHWHDCRKPAKYRVRKRNWEERFVCGVHRRSLLARGWEEQR